MRHQILVLYGRKESSTSVNIGDEVSMVRIMCVNRIFFRHYPLSIYLRLEPRYYILFLGFVDLVARGGAVVCFLDCFLGKTFWTFREALPLLKKSYIKVKRPYLFRTGVFYSAIRSRYKQTDKSQNSGHLSSYIASIV